MSTWRKIGVLFSADGEVSWRLTHASNPTAHQISDNLFRVYFSSRDQYNRALISFFEINLLEPKTILRVADKPLVGLGKIGAFDDNGMSVACILEEEERTLIYYLGWNLGKNVPFRNSIGVLIADSTDSNFKRISDGPIIDRNLLDPYSVSYPFVIKENGIYRMWYGSHKQWGKSTDDMVHCLKYAESKDGIHWQPSGVICIDTTETHYAFSRPFVAREGGLYKMWYSFRGAKYRIGYAESRDGISWERHDDQVGIDVSTNGGWDSDMICYPYLVKYQDKKYMFYNGNGYGKTGIGLAVLDAN